MQSNLSINSVQPNFRATVSNRFIKEAQKTIDLKMKNSDIAERFEKKVADFKDYGYDDYYIKYIKKDINGKRFHQLVAVRPGMDDSEGAVLTSKDKFRKAIEKFTHITKYEFTKKMEQFNQKRFVNIIAEA
jgi:hypothetical protein